MALIKWYEAATTGDCLDSDTTWNNMVEYIKHSACTDFTIHSTCTNIGQAFRFTQSALFSSMYGGENSGEDMMISANDGELRSRILLYGGGDIHLDSDNDVIFKDSGVQMFTFDKTGAISTIQGGGVTGDDLKIKTNTIDGRPLIFMFGNGGFLFDAAAANGTTFSEAGTTYGYFVKAGNDCRLAASIVNGNVNLLPNGTGKVKFGTYAAKGAEAFDGVIPIIDDTGTPRKLMTCA